MFEKRVSDFVRNIYLSIYIYIYIYIETYHILLLLLIIIIMIATPFAEWKQLLELWSRMPSRL